MNNAKVDIASHQQQNLTLLKVYTVYRIFLCIGLLATFILTVNLSLVGGLKPDQFLYMTTFYLLVNLAGLTVVLVKKPSFTNQQLFTNFCFDIAAVIVITDASSGVNSGLGILLVVIVAAGSIVLRGQVALLIAAIASIAIIADTARLISTGNIETAGFVSAGLLGIMFFFTSLVIQNLANRIGNAQILAEERAYDVLRLQSLNQQIVQRMRTGIIVTDEHGKVQLSNSAADEFLTGTKAAIRPNKSHLATLPPILMEKLQQWRLTPQLRSAPFRTSETGRDVNASFSALSDDVRNDTLIFLEDNRHLLQRAQQMKLASLGRLTASIAHEIRNPLSAVSHAAQLLDESEALDTADRKLSSIIQNHSRRMNNVIENVLELSRRNAPNPQKVVLKDWLQHFISEFEPENDQPFHLEITASDHTIEVTFDSSQLTQVITNLSQNGLRYSFQQSGSATLTYHIHINAETSLPVLDIVDDGPGVGEIEQEHLFEPFYTTETKGTGLGLYISRELCEANEARLDYLRDDNNRSCFRVSFPHPDRRL